MNANILPPLITLVLVVRATGSLLLQTQVSPPGENPSAAVELRKSFALSHGDVVAFVGGESVVAAGESGHLESLLAVASPGRGVRFRNLGREGDTVFEQPRELNFPSLSDQLKTTRATVIIAQFGGPESLAGAKGLPAFVAAYEHLCDRLARQTDRVVLLTPSPPRQPAANLQVRMPGRAAHRREYAAAVRQLAAARGWICVDLTSEDIEDAASESAVATQVATRLGLTHAVELAGRDGRDGRDDRWASPQVEAVRRAVVEKNRLWFEYARPMNWAFLGGDRQFVPSSRDPDDLKVRIFPRAMQKYVPLIERADAKIDELAKAAAAGQSK